VALTPTVGKAEQTNVSVLFSNRLVLKVFRRLQEGVNPELEVGRFLSEKKPFPFMAPVLGAIEYHRRRGEPVTLAVLEGFVPNQGTAWQYTLDVLSRFFEQVLATQGLEPPAPARLPLLELATVDLPAQLHERFDNYLEAARTLGRRTAEMHAALAADLEDPAFTPEPFTSLYQRSVYQSMRNIKGQVFALLRRRLGDLPETTAALAQRVLDQDAAFVQHMREVLAHKIHALRTRCHGQYHLGELLYTGKDFVIIDFEGDPDRSISDRRLKRSPLRDVASMVRSFHYAAYSALLGFGSGRGRAPGMIRPEDQAALEPWARAWYDWVSAAFLRSYQETAGNAPFLPSAPAERKLLFELFLLERALQELGGELRSRPDGVRIPLLGLLTLLEP
jgi:maltose alpha-D-glucosyltransferase/alpha-amylase